MPTEGELSLPQDHELAQDVQTGDSSDLDSTGSPHRLPVAVDITTEARDNTNEEPIKADHDDPVFDVQEVQPTRPILVQQNATVISTTAQHEEKGLYCVNGCFK